MNRSEPGNFESSQSQSEAYEQALQEYRSVVQAIELAGESVSVEQIEAAINARDRIHQILAEEHPAYTQSLTQVFASVLNSLLDLIRKCWRVFPVVAQFLVSTLSGQSRQAQRKLNRVREVDASLRSRSRQIRRVVKMQRVVPLSDLQEVLDQAPRPQWLRLFKSGKPWHDRYDWLWRGISLVCFIWAVALLVDTVNRFLTGGVSTGGVAAILGTVFLTLLSSGGVLTSFGQGELEKVFESFEIPRKWWDEWRCLLSVAALSLLIVLRIYGLPVASNCYAREPQGGWWDIRHCLGPAPTETQTAVSNQKVKVQESRYQRAIALYPDNFEAYFNLAGLYEQEMDYDEALKTYQMASRIGNGEEKQKADMGVIRMLIKKEDLQSADERLEENLAESGSVRINDEQYAVLKQLGVAYLEKGRQERNALQELRVYLGQGLGGASQSAPAHPVISNNDDLTAAVKWFEEGDKRTELDVLGNYRMQTFLSWAYWEQNNWGEASARAEDAIRDAETNGIESKDRLLLPICIKTHAMAMIQGQAVKQDINYRKAWLQCTTTDPPETADDPEFGSITEQIQQLNLRFQPLF